MSTPLPLGGNPTPDECRKWLREVCRWLGPGFHPDTRGEEYVCSSSATVDSGPLLTTQEADLYNNGIDACFALLCDEGYHIGLDEQRQMLRDALSARGTGMERESATEGPPPSIS